MFELISPSSSKSLPVSDLLIKDCRYEDIRKQVRGIRSSSHATLQDSVNMCSLYAQDEIILMISSFFVSGLMKLLRSH